MDKGKTIHAYKGFDKDVERFDYMKKWGINNIYNN